MKLVFQHSATEPLEIMLATTRYEKFWHAKKTEINKSFLKHTGLIFQQFEIRAVSHQGHSWSGDDKKPMRLNASLKEDWRLGGELLHELGHRLASCNGLPDYDGDPEWLLLVHKQLYLYLYDVWVDILGAEAATKKLTIEMSNETYRKAWEWVLSRSYLERQKTLKEMKKPKK